MLQNFRKGRMHRSGNVCFLLLLFYVIFLTGCQSGTVESSSPVSQNASVLGQEKEESESQEESRNAEIADPDMESYFFGRYVQKREADSRPEPIEWLVMERKTLTQPEEWKGQEALFLVSRYALDSKKICEMYGETTWENCDLRQWLNADFFEMAFSAEEQARILITEVAGDPNPEFNTPQGEDTRDRIFLLSTPEVQRYFPLEDQKLCVPTDYAAEKLSYENDRYIAEGRGSCWWWLRTMGADPTSVSLVRIEGTVFHNGHFADSESGCIRPAMWILQS